MSENDKVLVRAEITMTELRDMLANALKNGHPYYEALASVLIGVTSQEEYHRTLLFRAFSGLAPTTKYHIGQRVTVEPDNLDSWRFSRKLTLASKYAVKASRVICIVTKINVFSMYGHEVRCTVITDDGNELPLQCSCREDDLSPYTTDFEQVTDFPI